MSQFSYSLDEVGDATDIGAYAQQPHLIVHEVSVRLFLLSIVRHAF